MCCRSNMSDVLSVRTLASKLQNQFLHRWAEGQLRQRADADGDVALRDLAAFPDNAHADRIGSQTLHHHLVDEAAEQGFLACRVEHALLPEIRELVCRFQEQPTRSRGEFACRRLLLVAWPGVLGLVEFTQG